MERRGMQGLQLWCKRVTEGYDGVQIDNMTTSWRDGLAFCALIHHFRPELIDYSKLNKNDIFRNNELAFRVAQQYLGIPALLEPEDMVKYPVPDRLSILTYLSQFYKVFATNQSHGAVNVPARIPSKDLAQSASNSTTTKTMEDENKLSVPQQEPCTKCNKAVFLAERLLVDDCLYHSACFRCARCDNQLVAGNYYQTEREFEYCCETCPDEEKLSSIELSENSEKLGCFSENSSDALVVKSMDEAVADLDSAELTENAEKVTGSEEDLNDSSVYCSIMPDADEQNESLEYPKESNPFESSGDEEEKKEAASGSVYNDPFLSSDEEEVEEEAPLSCFQGEKEKKKIYPDPTDYWVATGSTGDTPEFVKMPRKRISVKYAQHSPKKVSVEPLDTNSSSDSTVFQTPARFPRNKDSTNPFDDSTDEEENLEDALSSLSINSTTGTYRKKKPAPKPPLTSLLEAKSPSSSIASSTSSLLENPSWHSSPKMSKMKRRAPLPPSSKDILTTEAIDLKNLPFSPVVHSEQSMTEDEKVLKEERNRLLSVTSKQDKSFHGKWKRKKGQAPPKPVAIKRTIKALNSAEVKKELDFIEVQLQGLEKQGVRLEEMIREKCEGPDANADDTSYVPIEVEDLILQLFEVVNEKNELCRKQAELMYMKRQHRLEEEQAEVEYEMRCLMLKPHQTDSDKVREQQLMARLVEIVDLRAEIVDCLEMDRVREAEEDCSISNSMKTYATLRDEKCKTGNAKKEKESSRKRFRKKVLSKLSHIHAPTRSRKDVDKDVDESVPSSNTKDKKKKLFR